VISKIVAEAGGVPPLQSLPRDITASNTILVAPLATKFIRKNKVKNMYRG